MDGDVTMTPRCLNLREKDTLSRMKSLMVVVLIIIMVHVCDGEILVATPKCMRAPGVYNYYYWMMFWFVTLCIVASINCYLTILCLSTMSLRSIKSFRNFFRLANLYFLLFMLAFCK